MLRALIVQLTYFEKQQKTQTTKRAIKMTCTCMYSKRFENAQKGNVKCVIRYQF